MDDGKVENSMNILAIETSLPHASLCLCRDGNIAFQTEWKTERNHDEWLFPALQKAMELLNDASLDIILVGAGPGSYGGVRVALAAAVGIAQVSGASVAALCSWAQLAEAGAVVVSDARRGGWTMRRENGNIDVVSTEELKQLQEEGVRILTIEAPEAMQTKGISPDSGRLQPTAAGLVQTWLDMSLDEQTAALNAPAEPIYVRPPHITKAVHKPWEIRR